MKNRIKGFKKAASILALAFAAVAGTTAGIEWNGYQLFDRESGDNLLCRADPSCRQLTKGEIAVARSVFGDSIDYNSVKLFNRRYMLVAGKDHNISPNGNIYLSKDSTWSQDYSGDPYWESVLIHELTHVWQVQNGRDVRQEAFREFFKSNFNYSAVYDFDIKSDREFLRHNLEQQAAMVERYYELRHDFRIKTRDLDLTRPAKLGTNLYRDVKTRCEEMGLYEAKIGQAIPLPPESACSAYRPKEAKKPAPSS